MVKDIEKSIVHWTEFHIQLNDQQSYLNGLYIFCKKENAFL